MPGLATRLQLSSASSATSASPASPARRTIAAAVACAGALALAAATGAQGKRAMSLVDLLEVPRLGDPQLSPDGRQIVFTQDRPDWKQNRRIAHIWRINADGTGLIQLTFGEKGESRPRWSPDGKSIAFLAKRGESEETQIHVIGNDGGEAKPLSKHATDVSNIDWSPDGKLIYFLAADPKSDAEKERDKLRDDVFAFDEDFKQRHLWTITVADGGERRLTGGTSSILSYSVSRDGRKLVTHRAPSPLIDDGDEGEVWVSDASGSNAVQVTKNAASESGAELSPDNSQVLFTASVNDRFEIYYPTALFVVSSGGGAPRMLIPDFSYDVEQATWSKDGRSIFIVANMGVHNELFQVEVGQAKPRQLTDGQHALVDWTVEAPAMGSERHLFRLDQPARAGEIWTLDASAGAQPRQVTRVYDFLERDFNLARQERQQWKGADGVTVEGLLFYPVDYQAGTKYPLVVQTHGGPRSSDKFGFGSWSSYVQVLTGKGYAVLKPNYRGSTGYGRAFVRDMVGHYFQNAHLDVMAGVDHVIKLGVADPDRLVKMGWSAGGHMTNKIITFTDRFKAASSGAGAANWVSMYAQSDTRTYRTPWFGGTPWQKNAPIEVYWNSSPLKDVANVKTPTIFLVGEKDPRVPSPQSVEMYRALKSNGVPTRLYIAPREPHGWTELRHQLFKVNVELEWFEKHARGRAYTWEKAPGEEPRKTITITPQG